MRATIKTFTVSLIATMATAGTAVADGYFEGVAGLAIPVSDDDYDNFADESFKFGVRAGSGRGPTALELGADFTPVNTEAEGNDLLAFSAQRFRVLLGARHRAPVGKNAVLFVRLAAGADITHGTVSSDVFNVEESDTDVGIAGEVGTGIVISLGNLYVGGHFAVPLAFHFDEDDAGSNTDASWDYTAIDIDLLFTIGMRQ